MARRHWFVRYRCGCSADAPRKRDLLDYCGTHGESAVEWLKLPLADRQELEGNRE